MQKTPFTPLFILLQVAIFFPATDGNAQPRHKTKSSAAEDQFEAYKINIDEQLNVFHNGVANAVYSIALCADVPYDKKPLKVAHQHQTGHVFLILQKINGSDTISKVFGFYPKRGLPTLFFKTIKSLIKDNSRRDYNAAITKTLTTEEFDTVLARSVFYAKHIYHINKFNCYDYGVLIFNSVAGDHPLPVNRSRYPFIFGKGGSPCTVYGDLKKLKEEQSIWADNIRIGKFVAPTSTGRKRAGKEKEKELKTN